MLVKTTIYSKFKGTGKILINLMTMKQTLSERNTKYYLFITKINVSKCFQKLLPFVKKIHQGIKK